MATLWRPTIPHLIMGRILLEAILYTEREQMAGPEYHPAGAFQKWGSQPGSVYLGGRKVRIMHPRLRDDRAEVALPCYTRLRQPGEFSEELLIRSLRGLSARKYGETFLSAADAFGISPSRGCMEGDDIALRPNFLPHPVQDLIKHRTL